MRYPQVPRGATVHRGGSSQDQGQQLRHGADARLDAALVAALVCSLLLLHLNMVVLSRKGGEGAFDILLQSDCAICTCKQGSRIGWTSSGPYIDLDLQRPPRSFGLLTDIHSRGNEIVCELTHLDEKFFFLLLFGILD